MHSLDSSDTSDKRRRSIIGIFMRTKEPHTAALFLLFVNVSLYSACFQAQLPVQPFIVEHLSSDTRTSFTSLRTFIAVLQMLGSLLSGWLVDRVGSQRVLLLSYAASALSYFLVARASSLTTLYIAQVPTLFQHAVLASRSYATSMLPAGSVRADALSHIAFAYGVGMVVGPAIGGYLAVIDLQLTAVAATFGSLVSVCLVWTLLPDSRDLVMDEGGSALNTEQKDVPEGGSDGVGSYVDLLRISGVPSALFVKGLFQAGVAVFQSGFSLLATEYFHLDVAANGRILSVGAAAAIFATIVVIPWLNKRFHSTPGSRVTPLCIGALLCLAGSFAALSITHTESALLLLTPFQTIPTTVFDIMNTALLCDIVDPKSHGSLHAANMSIASLVRIFSPGIAAALLTFAGPWSIGLLTSGMLVVASSLLSGGFGTAEVPSLGGAGQ